MDGYYAQQSAYEGANTSYAFDASTDWTTPSTRIAGEVGKTLYVQRIVLSVITDNGALQTWQDTGTVPLVFAGVKASPGRGVLELDFGFIGRPLTEGEGLAHAMSAAGMAGDVTILAYKRVTATSPA